MKVSPNTWKFVAELLRLLAAAVAGLAGSTIG